MRRSLLAILSGFALAVLVGDQLNAQQATNSQDQPAAGETNERDERPRDTPNGQDSNSDLSGASAVPLPEPGGREAPFDRSATADSDRTSADLSFRGRADLRTRSDIARVQDFNLGVRFGPVGRRGLTVATIERNSLFYDSGLRRGDVIISVHGRPIRTEAELVTLVRSRPGVSIPVVVLRNGREEIVYVTYRPEVIEAPPVVVVQQPQVQVVESPGFLGVMFDTEIPEAAIVRSVFPDSPAARMGLRPEDRIVALNGEAVSTYRSAVDMIDRMRAGEPLVITFTREVHNQAETVLAPQPGTTVRTASRPVDIRVRPTPAPVVVEQPTEVRVVAPLPPATR